jgi:RecA-family ATPase
MKPENGVYTAADVYDKIIPPMRWVVKDFMGEGTTLLSARPKAGKSLLALQIAIAVASGKPLFDTYETVQGAVLYVKSDDSSQRGLQDNLRLLGGCVEGLSFMLALPELDAGGLEILDRELARMEKTEPRSLLILDSLTALRKKQSDHNLMASIARLGRDRHCSILVISHTRKNSSTTGITSAVDTLMILTGADDTRKILRAKGRDIAPFEVHMELQVKDRSGWLVVPATPAIGRMAR